MFSNFQEGFHWFLLNYSDFSHATSHKAAKIWLNFSIWFQNLHVFEKSVWGVRVVCMFGGDEASGWKKHLQL